MTMLLARLLREIRWSHAKVDLSIYPVSGPYIFSTLSIAVVPEESETGVLELGHSMSHFMSR